MKKSKQRNRIMSLNRFGFTPVYLIALVLLSAVALVVIISKIDNTDVNISLNYPSKKITQNNTFKKFASADEFKAYLEDMDENSYYGMPMLKGLGRPEVMMNASDSDGVAMPMDQNLGLGGVDTADRFSDTNVQVAGIDEPDIVKTDGWQIYFSDNTTRYWMSSGAPMMRREVNLDDLLINIDPNVEFQNKVKTNIIKALPADELAISSQIDLTGDLLLTDNVLVVFSGADIVAYDVSNPQQVNKKWSIKLDDQTYLLTSRLYDGQIYLITQTSLNRYNPCPIKPLTLGDQSMIVPCGDIYYIDNHSQVDSTFTAISLNPDSGEFENKISFVGNQSTANIYMSKEAIYVVYNQSLNMFDYMFDFIRTEMNDLAPADVITRLNKLNSYDISNQSKLNELQTILDEWLQSLDKDANLKIQNEMENRANKYYEDNKRSLFTTGITKIDIKNLNIKSTASVPGYLLNQFAMDEYDDNLRVATTIGQRWGWSMASGDSQTNDVYVLDSNLKIKGSVTDLGLSERIYAARFIGDVGYLVTFRQTDPFYVLDLSNPKDPRMVGELKIPGYSSYLHPIAKDRILGIGMEDGKVKISYFDVSDPADPKEIAKYSLDEYGSDALYNHHAFLQDPAHQVFFLPSYQGGYVFSYANDNLELVRTVSVTDVKRALYINDYMYIIANGYVAILDENNWEKVNDLEL